MRKNKLYITSKERSCFAAQIQTTTDMIEIKIKGTNTSIHQCRLFSNLSQTRISNIRSNTCSTTLISIAL